MSTTFTYVGGNRGSWRVVDQHTVVGSGLARVARVEVVNGLPSGKRALPSGVSWALTGVTSHFRYAERAEIEQMQMSQPVLGRPEATCAALIPIRKSPEWWALAQDERRRIFEASSHHTQIGMGFLPAVARRLHHCHDLGGPFDFLTWFEYAPEDAAAFENLVGQLRKTPEWSFVERELDFRLERVKVAA